jgi:hypothetical protein
MEDVLPVYGLRAEQQRKGFALEAARAALARAFDMPAFSRVYAQTDLENQRSHQFLPKVPLGDVMSQPIACLAKRQRNCDEDVQLALG